MMKKTLFLLNALLLTGIGASAESITLGNSSWYAGSGTGTAASNYGDYAKENYNGSGHSAGVLLHQTATGLTANTAYVIEFFAAVNQANGISGTSGEGYAQVYAGSTTKDITVETKSASDFPNGSETAILGWGDAYHHILVATADNDGNIDFGVQNVTAAGNWAIAYAVSATPLSEYTGIATAHKCTATADDWTKTSSGSNGDFHLNTWSTEADASGMVTPFLEYWVASSSTLSAATISHNTITGLAAGYYEVSMDIRIFSEAGNTIGTGTTFTANSASEDLVTYGTSGSYGTETEVYGTYTLICQVDEESTLAISITIPSDVTYNWISFKNLDVVYMGTSLEYSIGTPTCSASCVKPGSTVSITFPDCITPTSGEIPTLSGSITVGDETVTGTLSYSGTIATVTFTMPSTIGYGETVTVSVPAGLIYWDNTQVSSAAATFTLTTPAIADQSGVYLMNCHTEEYLSRGFNWGTRADVDYYGIPVNIVADEDGLYTIQYVDNSLWLGDAAWAYADCEGTRVTHYTIETYDNDGVTGYRFRCEESSSSTENRYLYLNENNTENDDVNEPLVANNGMLDDNYTVESQAVWQIHDEKAHTAQKAAFVASQKAKIAELVDAADLDEYIASQTATDVTGKVTDPSFAAAIQPNATGSGWQGSYTHTEDGYNGTLNTGNTGSEIYNGSMRLQQTITGLDDGVYKIDLKGFFRQSTNDVCWPYKDYDMSTAYIDANGYQINLKPWGSGASLSGTTYTPDNMTDASALCENGSYANELYTYVSNGQLVITIENPGYVYHEWLYVKEMSLTYYGTDDYVYDVTKMLVNPSFEVDDVSGLNEDTTRNHTDDNDATGSYTGGAYLITGGQLTGWDFVNPQEMTDTTAFATSDIMTKACGRTDDNLGAPGEPTDGSQMLYIRDSWTKQDAYIEQTVTLPAGEYKMAVDTKCATKSSGHTAALVAKHIEGTDTTALASKSLAIHESASAMPENWDTATLTFSLTEETDVTLGVDISFANTNGLSVLLDNFRLYSGTDVVEWTLGADYGTLILPFDADVPSGLAAYTAGTVTDNELPLTEAGNISANTPYIIGGTAGTYYFAGVPENGSTTSYNDTNSILTGTLPAVTTTTTGYYATEPTTTTVASGNYVLQNQEDKEGLAFYLVDSEGITCGSYHCYLNESAVPSGVKSITFTFGDDVATRIDAVETEETANEAIYDLSGRRVAKAQKGVYIVNGKKMVIK